MCLDAPMQRLTGRLFYAGVQWREPKEPHLSEDRLEERKGTQFGKVISCSCDIRPKISWATRRVEKLPRHISTYGMCRSAPQSAILYHCTGARWTCAPPPRIKARFLGTVASCIASAQKRGFTIPDVPLYRSDRMPSSGPVRQTGRKAGMGWDLGGRRFFPCEPEQPPSELNWTPRTAFTCLGRQIALMAPDTCNGAEGGEKAPPPPPSLISSLK